MTLARFLSIGRNTPGPRWRIDSHVHPFFQAIQVIRGGQHLRVPEGEYHLTAGSIAVLRPDVPHEEWADPKGILETLFMDFHWDACPAQLPLLLSDQKGNIRVLMEMLLREYRCVTARRSENCDCLLAATLMQMVSSWNHGRNPLPEAVSAYVYSHLNDRITLDDLAGAVNLSKYHFLRHFKALTGLTPMSMVRRIRLDHARNLIMTTNRPLKEIAPICGLGDVYSMTRSFSREFGYPPGSLRNRPA